MVQYTNSTCSSDGWRLHFHSFPHGESLFVLLLFLYGLKIQLRKPNRQRNVKLIQGLPKKDGASVEYFIELLYLHKVLG